MWRGENGLGEVFPRFSPFLSSVLRRKIFFFQPNFIFLSREKTAKMRKKRRFFAVWSAFLCRSRFCLVRFRIGKISREGVLAYFLSCQVRRTVTKCKSHPVIPPYGNRPLRSLAARRSRKGSCTRLSAGTGWRCLPIFSRDSSSCRAAPSAILFGRWNNNWLLCACPTKSSVKRKARCAVRGCCRPKSLGCAP